MKTIIARCGVLLPTIFLCIQVTAASTYLLTAIKDTTLDNTTPLQPQLGSSDCLTVGRFTGEPKAFLVKFPNIPVTCPSVSTATLYLCLKSISGTPPINRNLCTHQVNVPWDEATIGQYGITAVPLGNDADPSCMSTVTFTANGDIIPNPVSSKIAFDVTHAAQSQLGPPGTPNNGILLRAVNEYAVGQEIHFYSRESSCPPQLEVICDP